MLQFIEILIVEILTIKILAASILVVDISAIFYNMFVFKQAGFTT